MWFKNKRKKARKIKRAEFRRYTPEEKIKLIKEYESMGVPAGMYCKWYGVSEPTLKEWVAKYKAEGEAGLENKGWGEKAEVPEGVREAILKLKESNPGLGAKKIVDYLKRNNFVKIYGAKVMEVLRSSPRTAHLIAERPLLKGNSDKKPVTFERSRARQMYQMDIMTFMLKGLFRVYLIACLDDYSRFVVSVGLYRRQSTDNVLDVLREAIERYGMPEEVLTDNGRQFYSWRGKSEFQKYLIKSGIQHIRSRPYHPQTLGKIESLWRNLYQELLGKVPLSSYEEAKEKIEEWIRWYNYKRPHQGIGGLVPADRYFGVEKSVREVMEKGAGMVKDALVMDPRRLKEPVYLVGKIGGKEIKVIAKEGSITVEGLEGVEEKELPKPLEVVKSFQGEQANGDAGNGEQISPTDNSGREVGEADGSMDREAESSGNLPRNGDQQGSVLPVGAESESVDAGSIEAAKDGKTGEQSCAG